MKRQKIQARLKRIDERLRCAEAYVARGENVESASFLHLKDWEGKSGHPLWIKNHMIPKTQLVRARNEKNLARIVAADKEKKIQKRRNRKGKTRPVWISFDGGTA